MKQKRSATILYIEPKRVADWCELRWELMRESPQLFSGKAYAIRLLHVLFYSEKPLSNDRAEVIKRTVDDYPELADEVKRLFPVIFK